MEVKKVWERKDGIKFVIIPKDSDIKNGDYVKIIKLENEGGNNGEENNATRTRKEKRRKV